MVELNSLNMHLENLKVLQEEAMLNGFTIETVKLLSAHIREVERVIEHRKVRLEIGNGFNQL